MEWFKLVAITVFLVALAAVCSGLNLALMALDVSDLKRKRRLGSAQARKVLPLRINAHLSLAAILLTNVAVISTTSLVLEHHFNGLIAGLASTLLIVIFGEIFPQALSVKHALYTSALFAPLLRLMILLTYPVAKPLQLLLDQLFGRDKHILHTRQELGLIIDEHSRHKASELDQDEVDIIRGALELSGKRVRDIMTPLEEVYWLTPDTRIDARRIDEIKSENWSRIPILDADHNTCHGVLLMKDLVDIDFDEQSFEVMNLPLHSTKPVGSMTALDTLFRRFIGAHSHLMPVERNDQLIGIVTIEDLIEEIIGREIEDESDTGPVRRSA